MDNWTNQEPITPLPGTLRGKAAFWIVGLTPFWVLGAVVLMASICG